MKEKRDVRALKHFQGEVLLGGIYYNHTKRENRCLI